MKIGILSMQRVINHGSFLQSYGLKKLVESLGHTVRFVDIKYGDKIYNETSKLRPSTPIYVHFFSKVNHILFNTVKKILFKQKYFPISGIDNPVQDDECDYVIIGSDEVFNFYQNSAWGLTDQLFGKLNCKAISYAGSFGNSNIEIIKKLALHDRLADDMNQFKAISVRDENSFECVKYITKREPVINLDPVLIFPFKEEQAAIQKIKFKNYIAIYCYDNGINDEAQIKIIKQFAKRNNKKIISLGFYNRWCDYNLICNPFELLVYFKNADYVITDTFHGSVIAIKQNRKFVTLVRNHNVKKLGDLLQRFGLTDRIINNFEELEEIIEKEIDYNRINNFIKDEQEKAQLYLAGNLK